MLNTFSVRLRLTTLSVLPIAVFIAAIIISLSIMVNLVKGIDTIYDDRVVPLKQIKEVSDNYAVNIVDLFHKYRAGVISQSAALKDIAAAEKVAASNWKSYLSTYLTPTEKRLVEDSKAKLKPVLALIEKNKALLQQQTLPSVPASEFNKELYDTFDPLSSSLANLIDLQLQEAERIRIASDEQFASTRTLFIFSSIVVVLLVSTGAWFVYRSIQNPINVLKSTIVKIAKSTDLTLRAEVQGNDEIAQMATGFNDMLGKIHQLVKDVNHATHSLAAAAEEMSTISSQVSVTTSEQSQQTTSIATSVEQMSVAIEEVAQRATDSSAQANQANDSAVKGQSKIQENIKAINLLATTVDENTDKIASLNQQTSEITQVVLMIQGVAEQTNLLALNAAIEAARAGESGRGFAVVADEVRQLAHNTQNATTKINDMITKLQSSAQEAVKSMEGAQANANDSVMHAEDSSQVLDEIVATVNEIADMNIQVSATTEEQTAVAGTISRNINEFAMSVSEVTDNANNSAQASAEVAELAAGLQQQVAKFTV